MVRSKTSSHPVKVFTGIEVLKQPKRRKLKSKGENTTPLVPVAENENLQKIYHLGISKRNENYLAGLVPVKGARKQKTKKSLRSCQLLNNAENNSREYIVQTQPKWNTQMKVSGLDKTTGEFIPELETYNTNDLKAGKYRQISAAKKFCVNIKNLQKQKQGSILLHTFTRLNEADCDIRSLIEILKARYKSLGRKIRGYFWVLEVSNPKKGSDFHLHYHLVVFVDRLNIKGGKMPEALKLNDVWGQRTQVEFLRKSLEGFLLGYLSKSDARLKDSNGKKIRMFGSSRRCQ